MDSGARQEWVIDEAPERDRRVVVHVLASEVEADHVVALEIDDARPRVAAERGRVVEHHIVPLGKGGEDSRSNMIVVSPTLHALIHADPNCTIDLKVKRIVLFGCALNINVAGNHNG